MNKPRCLITGSRYGLGQALVQEFQQDWEIIEYDLVLGQDLNLLSVRQQLIEDLRQCSVFFNNCQVFQRELLFRAHELQTGLCQVVSNSTVTYLDHPDWIELDAGYQEYIREKQALDADILLIHNLQSVNRADHMHSYVINVKMSYMDTPEHREMTVPKMNCAHVARAIRGIISLWPEVSVPQVVLAGIWPDSLSKILAPAPDMLP